MEGIEVEVKTGKLPVDQNGRLAMTRKQLREFVQGYVEETMMITLLSCIAWLMEEQEFKDDGDRLAEIFENVQRIIRTVYDPNEPFDKKALAKVVGDFTGVKVRWK